MDWYKRYIGDYRRDTGGLSLIEHGAYQVLLDEQYATEEGLPTTLPELYKLAHATTAAERAAVKKVVGKFFKVTTDGLRFNRRAQKEIKRVKRFIDQAVEAGKAGAEKRWKDRVPDREPHRVAHQNPNRVSIASQIPDPRLRTSSVPPERSNPARALAASMALGRNGKQKRVEEPEEDRVKKAVTLLNGDPACTEAEAARMFHVSIDAIREAKGEP